MDTNSFIVFVKEDSAEDVGKIFGTSNFELGRQLPKAKNKVIRLMKNELRGQTIKEFVVLWAITCTYLNDNNDKDNKAKGAKKYIIKRKPKFEYYKKCLEALEIESKINHSEKQNWCR